MKKLFFIVFLSSFAFFTTLPAKDACDSEFAKKEIDYIRANMFGSAFSTKDKKQLYNIECADNTAIFYYRYLGSLSDSYEKYSPDTIKNQQESSKDMAKTFYCGNLDIAETRFRKNGISVRKINSTQNKFEIFSYQLNPSDCKN